MKSAHSEPTSYPGLTRYEQDGRKWVALGTWTPEQMQKSIDLVQVKVMAELFERDGGDDGQAG